MATSKDNVKRLLAHAGITVNGDHPWDIQVHNENFYQRVLTHGTIGLGESYMENWWDCARIDQFITKVLTSKVDLEKEIRGNRSMMFHIILSKLFNRQQGSQAYKNAQRHYDIGNDLFSRMLDKRMVYTCGYWKNVTTLDEAQEQKLHLTCKKLYLEPGMEVLDIGCGWGSFAKFAAENYGVHVTGITVSKEQVELGNELCKGLPVEIKLMDYREVNRKFDRVVSLGMFEHVGHKNHRTYMEVAKRCMKHDALFLLHTIGNNVSRKHPDPWMNKYIFPNYNVPSVKQIATAAEGLFVMEDWHNFGTDYDKTLMAWYHNFTSHWDELKGHYDERFFRMWSFYLLLCAACFRAKHNMLWQIVFSNKERVMPYTSVRLPAKKAPVVQLVS